MVCGARAGDWSAPLGPDWDPRWPDPPIPGSFTGSVLHAHSYVDPGEPVDMRGKRVVVVGMGNSAMDLACELCQPGVAARLYLSARRGAWVVPNYLFGRPLDQLGLTHPLVPWRVQSLAAEVLLRALVGSPWRFGLPAVAVALRRSELYQSLDEYHQ